LVSIGFDNDTDFVSYRANDRIGAIASISFWRANKGSQLVVLPDGSWQIVPPAAVQPTLPTVPDLQEPYRFDPATQSLPQLDYAKIESGLPVIRFADSRFVAGFAVAPVIAADPFGGYI
jgi:hypothetical protein